MIDHRRTFGYGEKCQRELPPMSFQLTAPNSDGTREELEELLLEGLHSGEPVEVDERFWNHLRAETDTTGTAHQTRKPIREN